MQSPAEEWADAFRRARNALIGWTAVGAAALALANQAAGPESTSLFVGSMLVAFAACAVLYGLWRLARLLVIRRDLMRTQAPLGLVFVALVNNPLPRNIHELVAVWLQDPRVSGERLRKPDLRYMADLSEDERTDSFEEPVVREAWTHVRADGRPATGRWFRTADNLILTARRGGPFVRLATVRGFRRSGGFLPCPRSQLRAVQGIDRPVGFGGLGRAIVWRFIAAVGLGVLAVILKD